MIDLLSYINNQNNEHMILVERIESLVGALLPDTTIVLNDYATKNGFSVSNEFAAPFEEFLNSMIEFSQIIDREKFLEVTGSLSDENMFWANVLDYITTLEERQAEISELVSLDEEQQKEIIQYIFDNHILYRGMIISYKTYSVKLLTLAYKLLTLSYNIIIRGYYNKETYYKEVAKLCKVSTHLAEYIWCLFYENRDFLVNQAILTSIEQLRDEE